MSYFSYEEFGGVPSSDSVVRIINFNGADHKIRCADRGVPYLVLCHENQKTTMEGNWLLTISDEDCKQKIKLAFVLLAKAEQRYLHQVSEDISLLKQICSNVGITVDADIAGNFKYFLKKYLKLINFEVDIIVYKDNGETYMINNKPLSEFLAWVEEEQKAPKFLELLQEFQELLKKPKTARSKARIDVLRTSLYQIGTTQELKSARLL